MAADKPTPEMLKQLIDEANAESALSAARKEMISLFDAEEWRIVPRAEADGRKILRELGKQPTQWGIAEYCCQQLKSGFPIRAMGMGDPEGCNGIAHVMKNVDGNGLYIKLIIEEDGVRKIVKVLSFHY